MHVEKIGHATAAAARTFRTYSEHCNQVEKVEQFKIGQVICAAGKMTILDLFLG